jgi:SAM-dependent methyltransferase
MKGYIDVDNCPYCKSNSHELVWESNNYRLVKCTVCALAFIENPPSSEELSYIYSFKSGYMKHYPNLKEIPLSKWKAARHQYEILMKHRREKTGRLLDIGCSAGFFMKIARENGWDTIGLEISEDRAQLAREHFGLDVFDKDLLNVELKLYSFDVITMWDVLEHLANPIEHLKKAKKLLKPGGTLVIETPNVDGLFPRFSYSVSKLTGVWPHPSPPYHLFQFSKVTITSILRKIGFKNLYFIDENIPINYTFSQRYKSIKNYLYFLIFSPISKLGPFFNSGDSIVVFADNG